MKIVTFLIFTTSLFISAAAGARHTKANDEEMGDPNRVICRSEVDTGSRLARSKRCHTAAEWALIKREERMTVDRVQAMKPYQGQ
ncbi:hypothetical protein SAMN05444678_110181 [Sphingomonas sp. YR710]|uniref:hypothetical protein n=1 Tax=Sphingomonas sp. YR710 TaxID=1882773 RepID=UPI000889EF26|nr:hypothetical protein [Sphingomonas sp. YR710]SDD23208.1 hypothetical protein SAMN05444678_110181 [Sphingomonas sp. YR710]